MINQSREDDGLAVRVIRVFDYVSFEGVDGLDMGIREGNTLITTLSLKINPLSCSLPHLSKW